jgi:hypothetical protein
VLEGVPTLVHDSYLAIYLCGQAFYILRTQASSDKSSASLPFVESFGSEPDCGKDNAADIRQPQILRLPGYSSLLTSHIIWISRVSLSRVECVKNSAIYMLHKVGCPGTNPKGLRNMSHEYHENLGFTAGSTQSSRSWLAELSGSGLWPPQHCEHSLICQSRY